jgi:hypothetical protein
MPLPTAEPVQDQYQSTILLSLALVNAQTCAETYAANSRCRELCL